jgi:hypothetical protein
VVIVAVTAMFVATDDATTGDPVTVPLTEDSAIPPGRPLVGTMVNKNAKPVTFPSNDTGTGPVFGTRTSKHNELSKQSKLDPLGAR